MKLLLDQNLSRRSIPALTEAYPDSAQVGLLDMGQASDEVIWQYAKQHDFTIVTLDADFHEYSLLRGGPPLIVWLRCGNQRSKVIEEKLLASREAIEQAIQDPDLWCIELF
jgi:predicted nuclease of predicted toxin-antitoxin system